MRTLIALIVLLCPLSLKAEQYSIQIGAQSYFCVANTGQRVPIFTHPDAARAAAVLGGARVDYHPSFGYAMALNIAMLQSAPRLSAIMVFLHECGHAALPMGWGLNHPNQEYHADCWAIRQMRDYGYIQSRGDFEEAMSYIRQIGGLNGVTGRRIAAMWDCFLT